MCTPLCTQKAEDMTFTITQDRQLASLTVTKEEKEILFAVKSKAGGGLFIRVRYGSDNKSWIYRYRIAQKPAKLTLGSYPAMGLAQARKAHADAIELVRKGIDPRHIRKNEKQKNEQMIIYSELWKDWIEFRKTSKPISTRTLADYEGTYHRYLEKTLGNLRIDELTKSVIFEHLSNVRKTSSEAVRKGLIILNMTLDHANLQGMLEHNPARLLKPAMFGASMKKPRERWLPENELRMLWKALDDATVGGGSIASGGYGISSSVVLSHSVANALRLIIFTGVRRSEAAQMRWDQINGERWTIPATKNGKSHIVTLHPYMLSLIKTQREFTEGAYVFGSTSKPGFPITNDALTRALERVRSKYLAELTPFSPHDLRRSVATGCAEYLDAPERLIELLLNHVPKDRLIRTYQVGQQAEKLKNLFIEWGNFIMNNVITVQQNAPDNVIHIKFGNR